jgi:DNA-directed RNA polymerase specialized sigma subunit
MVVKLAIKRKNYQYKIVEISFEAAKLNNFSNERGIGAILAENASDDRVSELKEDLLDEVYDIVNGNSLTEHQKRILFMRLMGKTQNEIADHLGITQSAVHKAMHGNIDYKNQKKRYGGIIKKLQKICSHNQKVSNILNEIFKINKGEVE